MEEHQNFNEENEWIDNWSKRAKTDFLEYQIQKEHPVRWMIAERVKKTGKTVLDVGCATCNDYSFHKKRGITYTGLDPTSKFLVRALKLYPRITVKLGSVFDIPYDDNSFDVVYCKDLFEHLPPGRYRQAIVEMWRVARKSVMVAFFSAPGVKKTKHKLKKNGYWMNRYNKTEVMEVFNSLPEIKGLNITENIGYNNTALYELIK